MLERSTLLIIFSSAFVAMLAVLQATEHVMPIYIISAGLNVGNTLFHELGHSLFAWLFGVPNLPAILTIFGADMAAGVTFMLERNVILQILSLAALGYVCYHLRSESSPFFKYALVFTLFILIFAVSGGYELLIGYMGHGASILMGGFFLFRAWVNIQIRHVFERWLNGLFGFFLIFKNLSFSYGLVFEPAARWHYSQSKSGIGHNDFVKMAHQLNLHDVQTIAWFTMILCILTILTATFLAHRYLFYKKVNAGHFD